MNRGDTCHFGVEALRTSVQLTLFFPCPSDCRIMKAELVTLSEGETLLHSQPACNGHREGVRNTLVLLSHGGWGLIVAAA